MSEKDTLFIGTEDKFGVGTLITQYATTLGNLSKNSKKFDFEFETGLFSPGIFKWTQDCVERHREYKYMILIFDMDKQDLKERLIPDTIKNSSFKTRLYNHMLLFDVIVRKLEELYYGLDNKDYQNEDPEYIIDSQKYELEPLNRQYINITNPDHKSDYIGNRVVLIPVFFCFESLFLYSSQLLELLPKIGIQEYITDKRILLDEDCFESPIAFIDIYDYNKMVKRKNPQKYIIDIAFELIKIRFPELKRKLKDNVQEFKKTDKLFNYINSKDGDFISHEIIESIIEKAVFNRPFADLLEVSTDEEMENYIKRYCFHNYKYELEKIINLYGSILLWNPKTEINFKSLHWYKAYKNYVSSIYDPDTTDLYMNALDTLCTYYVSYYSNINNKVIVDEIASYEKQKCRPERIDKSGVNNTNTFNTVNTNDSNFEAASF